jgi:hypothetical protein
MHHNISYTDLDDKVANRKAVIDVLQWLGPKRFKILAKCVNEMDLSSLDLSMSLAGISGFPVLAMFRRYHTSLTYADRMKAIRMKGLWVYDHIIKERIQK